MSECPFCKASVDYEQKYNFCVNCQRQIKCKNCGEALLPEKTICLICGTPIVSQQTATNQINRYYLEEERTETTASRKIELTLTDRAIENAAPLFGAQLPLPRITPQEPVTVKEERAALPDLGQLDEVFDDIEEEPAPLPQTGKDLGKLPPDASRLFVKNTQDILIAQIKDYKGEQLKEQQGRFVLLYTWAYFQIMEKPVPSREHYTNAAKANHIFDNNFRKYFGQVSKKYLSISDGVYSLNYDGQKQTESVLSDIGNDTVSPGYPYWEGTKARRKRASVSKKDQQLLEEWVKKPSRSSNFDTRSLTLSYQWPMLALYDLTKELSVLKAVKPGLAYDYIKKRHQTIPFSKSQFTNALRRDYHVDKFARTSDGLYHLTPEAEYTVEQWLEGSSLPSAKDNDE